MDERAKESPQVTAEVLEEPISRLCDHDAVCLEETATVGEAIRLMQERQFGSVLVTKGGTLSGILTERDVLMKVADKDTGILTKPLTAIMTPNPETLRKDDAIVFVMNKMQVGGFRHVPIVDEDNRPLHVVSLRDVLRFLLDEFGSAVLNVAGEPYRGERKQYSA